MKKFNIWALAGSIILAAALLSGCGDSQDKPGNENQSGQSPQQTTPSNTEH